MQKREIERKIKSIQNIFEMTKAVELISIIKMKKAQRLALGCRPFAETSLRILKRLSHYQKEIEKKSLFFREGNRETVLAVVVTSDRGFAGAFNKNILNFFEKNIKEKKVEIFAIGKKGIKYFKKRKYKVLVEFSGIGDFGEFDEIKPIAELLVKYFREGRFRKILFFYPDFISAFLQRPTMVQLLPLDFEKIKEILKNYELKNREKEISEREKEKEIDYIFEPSPEEIFDNFVPQLVEYYIYHLILESNASEHSARMMAMKSASENTQEMLEKLELERNKARQAQITAEVTEISMAKEVLK